MNPDRAERQGVGGAEAPVGRGASGGGFMAGRPVGDRDHDHDSTTPVTDTPQRPAHRPRPPPIQPERKPAQQIHPTVASVPRGFTFAPLRRGTPRHRRILSRARSGLGSRFWQKCVPGHTLTGFGTPKPQYPCQVCNPSNPSPLRYAGRSGVRSGLRVTGSTVAGTSPPRTGPVGARAAVSSGLFAGGGEILR